MELQQSVWRETPAIASPSCRSARVPTSVTSLWAMRILSRTGHDPSGLLAVILGFFGGELLLLCLKTVVRPNVGSEAEEREENRDD